MKNVQIPDCLIISTKNYIKKTQKQFNMHSSEVQRLAGARARSIKQGKKPSGFLGLSELVTFVNSRWLKRGVSLLLQDSISTHKKGIRNLPASLSVDFPLNFLYLVTTQTVYECHKHLPFNSTD